MLSDRHRRWVPGNRWDLAADDVAAAVPTSVAVIVPYYEQPVSLCRLYAALAASRLPTGWEVVVADDGSADPPPPPPSSLPVRVVRQRDLGCRPGAARNRGAAATDAEVLVFVDTDTLPEPATVGRLARWPWVLPDALVVGRRHHADLGRWAPAATAAWLAGSGDAPPRGPDPAWLQAGHDETGDLLRADRRSYRFVISALMACSHALFDDIGGFASDRHEYGGDDWEMAYRAWVHGAVLVHDPAAVGWHDEPDWAQRAGASRRAKDAETMWLAERIPEPVTRGRGLLHGRPDVEIRLDLPVGTSAGQHVATIDRLLEAVPSSAITLPDGVPSRVVAHTSFDPRVHPRRPGPARDASSLELVVRTPGAWDADGLRRLLDLARTGDDAVVEVVDGGDVVAALTARRPAGRARRARCLGASADVTARLAPTRVVAAAAVGFRRYAGDVDLAAELGRWAGG